MREIKLRVWDKMLKCFWYELPDSYTLSLDGKILLYGNISKDMKLIQFTGLQDVTGKDIFDGDIVEFDYYESERNQYENIESGSFGKIEYHANTCSYDIVFSKEDLCISIGDEDTGYGLELNIATRLKVIGNIFENPELFRTRAGKRKLLSVLMAFNEQG